MNPEDRVWTCRDGRKLMLREMADDHLVAAYRMMRSKAVGVLELQSMFNGWDTCGDMAQLALEREITAAAKKPVSAWVDYLNAEVRRRGLA